MHGWTVVVLEGATAGPGDGGAVTSTGPTVAVIIPTHNRHASLERTLRSLTAGPNVPELTEIIVVADGCSDRTREIRGLGWPVSVRLIEQPRQGPAAARNRGAAAATADILIFLDDDIEVWSGFVGAHLRAHAGHPARVVIGYLPPELQERRDFFAIMLRAWWEAMFDPMRDPGHRFSYSDLLSGNFSIRRDLFDKVGGFNELLHCHEDYELGFRLIGADARFAFAEGAAGWHHERTDLMRALARKRDEGAADIELARRHPSLAPALPLCRPARGLTRRARMLRSLAVAHPGPGALVERCCRSLLPVLETVRLRTRWRRLLDDLLLYWYWRGVGESMSGSRIAPLCDGNPVDGSRLYDLDLEPGLSAAVQEIDRVRPEAVRLWWGPVVIGTVPSKPGAEPIRGRHLPSLLRRDFARQLGEALAGSHQREATTMASPPKPYVPDTADDECSLREM
jgi:GT2 family glycosyltransferase